MNQRRTFTLLTRLIPCLTILMLGACQKQPSLIDTLGTAVEDVPLSNRGDPRGLAPIIVVASVEGNQIIAKHMEAARYKGIYLDLHVVQCKRENSLKGGLTGPELTFFYFADGKYPDSKPNPRYRRLFQAKLGSRYLFFLTRDRGVLRSIIDVGDYSILVSTGTHPDVRNNDEDIGRRISEVLLTPADGADLELMKAKLSDYSSVADIWGSRLYSVQLLRHLLSLREPVRSAACGVLVSRYRGQYDCLQVLAEDANESLETRQSALVELKQQSAERELMLEDLKDPAQLAYADFDGDSRRRVREELQTFLFAPDRVLRERVCGALKRYYPYDTEPGCSPARQ